MSEARGEHADGDAPDRTFDGPSLGIERKLQYRQGDVLLVSEPRLPPDVVPVSAAGEPVALLLAGSAAEGTHLLQPSLNVRAFRSWGHQDRIDWLEIRNQPVTLIHPQHAPLQLYPGIWRVVRQREYDPALAAEAMFSSRRD